MTGDNSIQPGSLPGDQECTDTDFSFGFLSGNAEPKRGVPKSDPWPEAPEQRPVIAEGLYIGEIVHYQLQHQYQFPDSIKLHLKVSICVDPEKGTDVVLVRSMNYSRKPSPAMDFYKEWVKVNGGEAPKRADRMSPRLFVGKRVRVRVRTVVKDHQGDALPSGLQYSVVGKILEMLG